MFSGEASSSSSEDDSSCHLLALSHDELGVVVDGLADPLQPVVAVALSSTCKALLAPLRAALEVLKQRHEKAAALCRKGWAYIEQPAGCAYLRTTQSVVWINKKLSNDDMATLAMILRTNGLPSLASLHLGDNAFDDAGLRPLIDLMQLGSLPLLINLGLQRVQFGPLHTEALGAAFGAMPKLEWLDLQNTYPLGETSPRGGMNVLARPLRKLHKLKMLGLNWTHVDDEGVALLLADLRTGDFQALEFLQLSHNKITDVGCGKLADALKAGALPRVREVDLNGNPASDGATAAVQKALYNRRWG